MNLHIYTYPVQALCKMNFLDMFTLHYKVIDLTTSHTKLSQERKFLK